MKVLGIVPARRNSKRLKDKNMRLLGKKPLCQRALEAALGARRLDRVVVSSDDERVLAVARKLGADLCLERPASLATDTSQSVDFVFHALEVLEGERGEGPYDAVCIIPPTTPFTEAQDIDSTIALLESTGAESAVSVGKLDHAIHPFKLKVLEGDRLMPYVEEESGRMAAHELPTLYARNGAVYASRRDVFFEYRQIIGRDMRAYVMPPERSVDVNTDLDLAFAEFLLARASL